jgi:carboxylesterase
MPDPLTEYDVVPGCESWSAPGGPNGVLCVHGFTGNPHSVRGIAEACAAAGFAVELPRLPGHGTAVEDLIGRTFDDWRREAEAAYQRLAAACERVVIVGLSMGGTVTLRLVADHPEVAGFVAINPLISGPAELREAIEQLHESGMATMPAVGNDIADPDSIEYASYDAAPLAPLLSLFTEIDSLVPRLSSITVPALVLTSRQDHVVPTESSVTLVESLGGPVEHVWLERSFHVAPLDYDGPEVLRRTLDFAKKVTAG